MVILLIIGIIVLLLGIFAVANKVNDLAFAFGATGSSIILMALISMQESSEPSAIDVYQGKTTLEITYRDGVPVDSVVVFKKNKEK